MMSLRNGRRNQKKTPKTKEIQMMRITDIITTMGMVSEQALLIMVLKTKTKTTNTKKMKRK